MIPLAEPIHGWGNARPELDGENLDYMKITAVGLREREDGTLAFAVITACGRAGWVTRIYGYKSHDLPVGKHKLMIVNASWDEAPNGDGALTLLLRDLDNEFLRTHEIQVQEDGKPHPDGSRIFSELQRSLGRQVDDTKDLLGLKLSAFVSSSGRVTYSEPATGKVTPSDRTKVA